MLTLRCTKRLADRLRVRLENDDVAPTTALGDWYVTAMQYGRAPIAFGVSERTLLPILLPLAPAATLVERFRHAVIEELRALGVGQAACAKEEDAMREVRFGRTANRRVLGSLNDYMRMATRYAELGDRRSLFELSLHLANTPCGPIDDFANDATREALGAPRKHARLRPAASAMPQVPEPPRALPDRRQRATAAVLAKLHQALDAEMETQSANLTAGFPAAAVNLGTLQDVLAQGLGQIGEEALREEWEAARGWMVRVVMAWVQRVKQVRIDRVVGGVRVEFRTRDDRGEYSYGFDVTGGPPSA